MDDKVYIIEECLAPGVWVLFSDAYYTSKDEADEKLYYAYKSMEKYKKNFRARVTELSKDGKKE